MSRPMMPSDIDGPHLLQEWERMKLTPTAEIAEYEDQKRLARRCPECDGEGGHVDVPEECERCGGTGEVVEDQ